MNFTRYFSPEDLRLLRTIPDPWICQRAADEIERLYRLIYTIQRELSEAMK